jgi:predicted dehydrogenase
LARNDWKIVTTQGEIRVALIGFGYASKTFHAPLLRATDGYRITAVASTQPAAVRATLPDIDIVADPNAIAIHPGVDLVVIASPNDTHAPLAELMLRAGKNVVVEKPFTLSVADARHLANVARESGTLLSVFHNRRWDSDFLTVQKAIAEGALGDIVLYESHFDRYRPQVLNRWREQAGAGSGLLYDLGPHLVDQTLVLFGMPDSVQASLAKQRPLAQTIDYFQLVLRYGKCVATLQAGSLVAGGSARFIVHGNRASLVKHKPDIQEDQLRSGMTPGAPGWGADPDDALLYEGGSNASRVVKTIPGDQRGFYVALREALHGGAPNRVTPLQAASVMSIIEAALRAEAEGRRVVPDITDEERAAWT